MDFVITKMKSLLEAKTINPITGEVVDDNVTQRDMLKLLVKDLMQLGKKEEKVQANIHNGNQVIQVFNTDEKSRQGFK